MPTGNIVALTTHKTKSHHGEKNTMQGSLDFKMIEKIRLKENTRINNKISEQLYKEIHQLNPAYDIARKESRKLLES
jgi:hypothetical protein